MRSLIFTVLPKSLYTRLDLQLVHNVDLHCIILSAKFLESNECDHHP